MVAGAAAGRALSPCSPTRSNRPRHRLPVARAADQHRRPRRLDRRALALAQPRDPDRRPAGDHRLGLRHALDGRARPPQRCTRLRPAGARRTTASHRSRSIGGRVAGDAARPAGLARPRVADHALGRRLRLRRPRVTLVASVAGSRRSRSGSGRFPDGFEMGLYNADTLPWAIITAFLAAPLAWVTVWVIRGLAKFHASLAVELLGPPLRPLADASRRARPSGTYATRPARTTRAARSCRGRRSRARRRGPTGCRRRGPRGHGGPSPTRAAVTPS